MPSDVSVYTQMDASSSTNQQRHARVLSIVAFEDVKNLEWERVHSLISVSAERASKWLTLVLVSNAFAAKAEARAVLFPYVQRCVTTATSLAHTSVKSRAVAIDVLLFGWSSFKFSAHMYDAVYSNSPDLVQEIIGNVPYLQVGPQVSRLPFGRGIDTMSTGGVAIDVVSVNGTFDHLHLGHKNHLLLSAWLTTKTLHQWLLCAVSSASPSDPSHKKLSLVGRTAAKEYDTAASRSGALFIPITLHCNIEEIKPRVVSKARSETSPSKLVDPVRAADIATQKMLCTFEHAQALCLNVSLISAEQAAVRIAEHVIRVSKKG